MSERIRGSYDDALYKSTYTLLYFTDDTVVSLHRDNDDTVVSAAELR